MKQNTNRITESQPANRDDLANIDDLIEIAEIITDRHESQCAEHTVTREIVREEFQFLRERLEQMEGSLADVGGIAKRERHEILERLEFITKLAHAIDERGYRLEVMQLQQMDLLSTIAAKLGGDADGDGSTANRKPRRPIGPKGRRRGKALPPKEVKS